MRISRKVALAGVLAAATMILSYIESLVPLAVSVPGIKLGLANVGVLITLYTLGAGYAAAVSIVRVVLNGLLFGGVSAMLYSLAGAALALAAMLPLKASGRFGAVGVSVAGAVAHILGQLAAAHLLTGTAAVWTYLPALMIAACVTGAVNGTVAALVTRGLNKSIKINQIDRQDDK